MSALESLGSSLTKAVRKLLKSPIADERAVKELIREFQRALLQSDVNVRLVLELSQEIEKRALEERLPPGISRREHVVKVVYECLTEFLGEKPAQISVKAGKPNVFMMVGIQGSGKCVEGSTLISLADGVGKKAAELFDECLRGCETAVILEDGLAIKPKSLEVQSVNLDTLMVEEKTVEWLWRLKAPSELWELELDWEGGLRLTTTPEHPFFVKCKDGVKRVRAEDLRMHSYVMTAPCLPLIPEEGDTAEMKWRGSGDGMETAAEIHRSSGSGLLLVGEGYTEAQLFNGRENSGVPASTPAGIVEWAEVRGVWRIENHRVKYVYDLTVEDNHNFVANHVVVNNTTSAAKMARYFQRRGFKTGLVCADTFRPGAFEQLKQLANQINVPLHGSPEGDDALKIAVTEVEELREDGFEVIILDTAGRHKEEKSLIREMREISQAVKPEEVVLVVDSSIGQQAFSQAEAFHKASSIGSIFLAKLDGSARGGGALSAVAATGVPIKFIGTGERLQDIEPFNPSGFVGRLLGMGDIEGLVKRVKEAEVGIPEEKARAILKGKFTLDDMYQQIEAMSGMGPLRRVLKMIPGMGYRVPDEALEVAEDRIKRWKYALQSMTEGERENPRTLNSSRIKRVARGSGISEKEVKELVNQYFTMRKLMKSMGRRKGGPFLRKLLGKMK